MLHIATWIYLYAALGKYFILIPESKPFVKLVGTAKSDGVPPNKREIAIKTRPAQLSSSSTLRRCLFVVVDPGWQNFQLPGKSVYNLPPDQVVVYSLRDNWLRCCGSGNTVQRKVGFVWMDCGIRIGMQRWSSWRLTGAQHFRRFADDKKVHWFGVTLLCLYAFIVHKRRWGTVDNLADYRRDTCHCQDFVWNIAQDILRSVRIAPFY
jgi:hypothetical protein